jgi:hypothetical protein
MPKRQTIIYTSNDAPRTDGTQLFVYYCRYSGKHAFTTGAVCVCGKCGHLQQSMHAHELLSHARAQPDTHELLPCHTLPRHDTTRHRGGH